LALLLFTVVAAMLLASGVALAANITCVAGARKCVGTAKNDVITGADALLAGDVIYARAGDDVVKARDGSDFLYGGTGDDQLHGDGVGDSANDRSDHLEGGGGADELWGYNGADGFSGGSGPDVIHADFADTIQTTYFEVSLGKRGNDTIYAADGFEDHIGCGDGTDQVFYDAQKDVVNADDCEIRHAL
jgi:Ca2+-binding RTX toxin-like protein